MGENKVALCFPYYCSELLYVHTRIGIGGCVKNISFSNRFGEGVLILFARLFLEI